ncbi:MAG: DUF2341 domain-containing protein, partial [Bacteroidales bacterium]
MTDLEKYGLPVNLTFNWKGFFQKAILIPLAFLCLSHIAIAQTGPGGVGSGANNPLWLRADSIYGLNNSDPVSLWNDVSGNGNDFIQSGTERPFFLSSWVNGFPALDFDGLDDYLVDADGAGYINGNTAISFFSVTQSESTGVDRGFISSNTSDDQDIALSVRYDQAGIEGSGTNVIKASVSTNNYAYESDNNVQTTGRQLISFHWTGGNDAIMYIDGSLDTPTSNETNGAESPVVDADYVSIGLGPMDNWYGQVAELILFNENLNSARRNIVENYLAAKYGLTISNDKYNGNDAAYIHNVAGIGQESDGSNTSAISNGFQVSENNATLSNGEYLLFGHNNALLSSTTSDVTGSVEARWNRIWYFDKTGSIDATIRFDFREAINAENPRNPSNYVLLYRTTTSGDFSVVTSSAPSIENCYELVFEVADDNLPDGYYTLGTTDNTNSPVEPASSDFPTASIIPDPANVCEGEIITLDGNPSGGSGSYDIHEWTGAGSSSLDYTDIQSPDFSNGTAGDYYLTYTVTDDQGCQGSDDITVTVDPLPEVYFGGYEYVRTITVPAASVSGSQDLTDYPLLVDVNLDETHITSSSGYDVIFTDSDGSALDFELQNYNSGTGQYTAWVRIPVLSASSDTEINILYGNPEVTTDQSDQEGVWNSGYTAVWHMEDAGIEDATRNGNDGNNNGTSDIGGKIGLGRNFEAIDRIQLPDNNSIVRNLQQVTLSGWVNIENHSSTGVLQAYSINSSNKTNLSRASIQVNSNETITLLARSNNTEGGRSTSSNSTVSTTGWHHIAGVIDYQNDDLYIYINGVLD